MDGLLANEAIEASCDTFGALFRERKLGPRYVPCGCAHNLHTLWISGPLEAP